MEDLPVVIVGHVDHGKSTLVGRLLIETRSIPDDLITSVEDKCSKAGKPFEPAFLLDAFMEEQSQGITIDITQTRIQTDRRRYTIIDAPGHREFLKNMLSGAAQAKAAILLIDAQEGVCRESLTHCQLLSFLGIKKIIVAVNKMDLVDFDDKRYQDIVKDFSKILKNLGVEDELFIPISALTDANVLKSSQKISWYTGPSLLEALDQIPEIPKHVSERLIVPVQDVYKFDQRRILVGRIESGSFKKGDHVCFSPSGKRAQIATIEQWPDDPLEHVSQGDSVGFTLDDQLFIERGQVMTHHDERPICTNEFIATVFWLGKNSFKVNQKYKLKLGSQETQAQALKINSRLSAGSEKIESQHLAELNQYEIGRLTFKTTEPLAIETFEENISLGRFVLIDDHIVAGSGTITESQDSVNTQQINTQKTAEHNVFWEVNSVTYYERMLRQGHHGCVIWFTGLPSAGKSTIGNALARRLFDMNYQTYRLDGDNIRHGLCNDLGFSQADREENIRRVGEVSKLMADAGMIVIATFVSPYRKDRDLVKKIIPEGKFFEIFTDCPLSECEKRDTKGLYKKARQGKIKNMTGVSDNYEPPLKPDLIVTTDTLLVEHCVDMIIEKLHDEHIFNIH